MVQGPHKYIPLHLRSATTKATEHNIWWNSHNEFEPYPSQDPTLNINLNLKTVEKFEGSTGEKKYFDKTLNRD